MEEEGGGMVYGGDSLLEGKFCSDAAAGIISALFAAIADGPRLLVVVAGGRGRRPGVAVAGNFSAVVEIVEHAELQRQLVLVGRDVGSIHGERGIAVANG